MSKAQELNKIREKAGHEIKQREYSIIDKSISLESYYESILPIEEINKSIHEYRGKMDEVTLEFKERTKLQDKDICFLVVATLLQCARIFLVNNLTKIEKAGSTNRNEDALHKLQNKVLGKFDNGVVKNTGRYYAPLNQIITGRGVPYDATAFMSEKYDLFRGANHRFSTLGHDPTFGLIFGTSNILTNTITCINKPLITTNHVIYDINLKNPKIDTFASTIKMFEKVTERIESDKSSVVAAVIKQFIHIGTDLYTPFGIQLPGANLILSKEKVEKLTQIISTGDVIKFGVSAGLAVLINTIISTIYGCKFLYDEKGNFSQELYSIKARKIILYSNLFATSSNVLYTALTKNVKNLDIGGFATTAYRLFSDTRFFDKIKYEFLNSQVSKAYENKMRDLSIYYSE